MMRLLLFILIVLAQPAWGAETVSEPSLLGSTLKMVAAMAIIIGIMLLFLALSKKGFKVLPQKKGGLINVVETRPLGGRKFLCVVRIRDEELLLGLSNDRIECLTKLAGGSDFSASLQHAEEERS